MQPYACGGFFSNSGHFAGGKALESRQVAQRMRKTMTRRSRLRWLSGAVAGWAASVSP